MKSKAQKKDTFFGTGARMRNIGRGNKREELERGREREKERKKDIERERKR